MQCVFQDIQSYQIKLHECQSTNSQSGKERQETLVFENNRSALTMQLCRKKASEAQLKQINAVFWRGKTIMKRACAEEKFIFLLDLTSN